MTGREAVAHMVGSSGRSMSAVSTDLGKHRNFIVSSLGRESWNPTVETLAAIARACGYSLVLVGNGESVEVDG